MADYFLFARHPPAAPISRRGSRAAHILELELYFSPIAFGKLRRVLVGWGRTEIDKAEERRAVTSSHDPSHQLESRANALAHLLCSVRVRMSKLKLVLLWTIFALPSPSLFLSQSLFAQLQQVAVAPDPGRIAKIPLGSYQLTCVILDVHTDNLRAVCRTLKGDWLATELHNPSACTADISNENGKLTCNRSHPRPLGRYLEALGGDAAGSGQRPGPRASMQAANWQLEHDSWTFKDGAPQTRAVAQTTDGFLWLGGPSGLYRFDGRQFELFHSPFGEELLSTSISSLYAPPSGGLWIGYLFGGASFLDKGRVTNYGGAFANSGTIYITEDKDGIVWAASPSSGLWRLDHSDWQHVGTESNVSLKSAMEVALDQDGSLWVSGEGMLLRLPRGSRRFQIEQQNVPLDMQLFSHTGKLVDQEGNIWFSGPKGIDRFFYSPLVKHELEGSGFGFALAADDEGEIWAGAAGAPLYRVALSKPQSLPKYHDWGVQSMYRAPDGTIWIGTDSGLWHETLSHHGPSRHAKERNLSFEMREALWRFTGRDWDLVEFPREVADQGQYLQAITQDRQVGMWISFGHHGLYRLADGAWTPFGGHKDLPTTGVVSEFTDSQGRVWFGFTKSQLAVLDGDRVQVYGSNDGLHVGNITAGYGRGPAVWIGGEFGLQQFDAGHFKTINAGNPDLLRGISGIVEMANGDLWLNGFSGIFHIRQSELAQALNNPSYRVKGEHYGRRGGLPGFATQIRPLPSAIEGTDGRLWFAVSNGVVSIDPTRSEHGVEPPPVVIQSISANGQFYSLGPALRFPAHTSDVQIGYAAVSLSDPEAIHFRYKLEETDPHWHEVDAGTAVTYRNLAPGVYHFCVDATDTNGVWSDKVATAEFTILPAFYQTGWFIALCAVSSMALLYVLYMLRERQLVRQFEVRMEERIGERTRIARELHDTLLQSFHAVLLKLQAGVYMIRNRPDEAEKAFDAVIEQAEQAVNEGRDAVQGLRSSTVVTNDLPPTIRAFGAQLVATQGDSNSPDFRVEVEGTPRHLPPIVRDEVYRIASEAVRNAFQHAMAKRIDVEIRYDRRQLRLCVRDDGKGMDPNVLESGGRAGHYGLPGLQERAKLVSGTLIVRSDPGSGTTIELTIPASIVYASSASGRHAIYRGKRVS
jgi:signal transduction histidine kinase/ligand-binding sensor domain-containing protein